MLVPKWAFGLSGQRTIDVVQFEVALELLAERPGA